MGHSYICILGMVRRSANYISETIATLNFVLKCKQIKNIEPSQCCYNDIIDEPPGDQTNKESVEERLQQGNSFSQKEFSEFALFLGKCLVGLSRMIKKVNIEFSQKTENPECYDSDNQEGIRCVTRLHDDPRGDAN